jgi:ribosomal protein S18 acetylase RimI-like enzyme
MGKTLMTSAEKWSSDLGYELIQVVTQGDNYPACRLYESCGYEVDAVEFFYHIWKK